MSKRSNLKFSLKVFTGANDYIEDRFAPNFRRTSLTLHETLIFSKQITHISYFDLIFPDARVKRETPKHN